MAGSAVFGDTVMIEHGCSEAAGHVAHAAVLGRRDVTDILSGSGHAMTAVASPAYDVWASVINEATDERAGVMAHAAI